MITLSPLALVAFVFAFDTLEQTSLTLAQREGMHFDFTTVTFLAECLKFLIALGSYVIMAPKSSKSNQFSWERFFQFGIPGVLYFFVNNSTYYLLLFLVPAEAFMIKNFKILATAWWLRVVLGRQITKRQLVALLFLALGCILQAGPEVDEKKSAVLYTGHTAHFVGVIATLVTCSLSALSNVVDEMLMKHRPDDSLMFQNMHVYFWGILVNGSCLLLKSRDQSSHINGPDGIFTGYNLWVVVMLIFLACQGLFISATMRFVDNIAVVYAHAASIIAVLLISVLWFEFRGNVFTWTGAAMIIVATIWYAREGIHEARNDSVTLKEKSLLPQYRSVERRV